MKPRYRVTCSVGFKESKELLYGRFSWARRTARQLALSGGHGAIGYIAPFDPHARPTKWLSFFNNRGSLIVEGYVVEKDGTSYET